MEQLESFRKNVMVDFSSWSMQLVFACAAIGFMTMTIVEMIKRSVRGRFNSRQIESWLGHENRSSVNDLIFLATAGDQKAFYNLAIENLCGQIVAAMQVMFESPAKFEKLISALLKRRNEPTEATSSPSVNSKDNENDDFKFLMDYNREKKETSTYEEDPSYSKYVSVRARLSTQIQRNLDAFQINSTYRWQNKLRFYSLVVSFYLSVIIAYLVGGSLLTLSGILFFAVAAYVGAFTASVFRDMLSVLERYKK